MTRIKNLSQWPKQKGQVLVLVALMFLILIAFIGLAMDVGVVFVGYSRLRRAVDSAALSAAGQFRKGYTPADLVEAAEEFLRFNEINDPSAVVETCAEDATMCTDPPRKLVRVTASSTIPLSFMTVLGFREVTVSAEAVSEAASLEAVIVIDTSESMNSDGSGALNNLQACNEADPFGNEDLAIGETAMPGECHPFEEVKRAAYEFVGQLFFPYDRVSIVTFDQKVALRLPLEDNKAAIQEAIGNLAMMGYDDDGNPATYDITWLPPCTTELGLCLHSATGGSYCDPLNNAANPYYIANGNRPDPRTCTNTNIGGGVEMAGSELATDGRLEALWVIILLTDGAANAGISPSEMSFDPAHYDGSVSPFKPWICPESTWGDPPFCRDDDSNDRHYASSDPTHYDADDYARDMMDAATHKNVGGVRKQIAYMYTIGLGPQVTASQGAQPDAGEKLLQYGASSAVGQGAYEFAPTADDLREIFRKIAENIATRLSH